MPSTIERSIEELRADALVFGRQMDRRGFLRTSGLAAMPVVLAI
jgi:hypothetical protein